MLYEMSLENDMKLPENRRVRFIDSKYNDKFTVKDGGTVVISHPNKMQYDRWENIEYSQRCVYIDDCHLMILGDVYHIRQLAEKFESLGITVSPETEENYDTVWYFGHNTKTFLHVWRKDEIENIYSFTLIFYLENEDTFVEIEEGEYFLPDEFTSYDAREYIIDEVQGYSSQTIDFFKEHCFDLASKPRYRIDNGYKFWDEYYEKGFLRRNAYASLEK